MKSGGLFRSLQDLLLPPACLRCGSRIPIASPAAEASDLLLCAPCRAGLVPPPAPLCERCGFPLGTGRVVGETCLQCRDWDPAVVRTRAAVLARGTGSVLVHGLKYQGWSALSREMGKRMARVGWGTVLRPDSVLIPIPTTRRRKARRGYDQAELLALAIHDRTGNPVERALSRRGKGRSQVGLHPQERWTNVRDAFAVSASLSPVIVGAHVVLVDDVLTTGATLCAAARELQAVGVMGVNGLVFARAQPDLGTV